MRWLLLSFIDKIDALEGADIRARESFEESYARALAVATYMLSKHGGAAETMASRDCDSLDQRGRAVTEFLRGQSAKEAVTHYLGRAEVESVKAGIATKEELERILQNNLKHPHIYRTRSNLGKL